MMQEPPPFLIGERLNTQGSRKFKELIMVEDFDSVLDLARQQVDSGAHGLDLCTALTERSDEGELMRRLIKTLAPISKVPFIIDSTEPDVVELALKTSPGRCLINSTNLEAGRAKSDRLFAMAKIHNASVIVLTIDEQGMAKTAERKLEVARRIYDIAINDHGLRPSDLVFDTLTFTLATGDPEFNQSAIETINSIKLIKTQLPGVLTSLGISNVSFGLTPPARGVLNSVMLYHCVKAGLDMAIVNPAQITPYADISQEERELAEDMILNHRPDALQRLIEHFEKSGPTAKTKVDNQQTILQTMTAEERLHWRIVHRYKDNLEADIDEIIQRKPKSEQHVTAVEILNNVLLPAMKEVGDKFGSGELILPFVLQSAEVMKKSVGYLENFLEKTKGVSKGTLVLATVYGDVHDIGKNLVKTILSNNGFQVIDLGKQVPAETIISKAVEVNADAIGLSALLVSTSKQMPLIVNELQRRGLKFPVLIGGAAINQRFGRRILFTEQEIFYEPGVYYCKDAFEGLATMEALRVPEQRLALLQKVREDSETELGRAPKTAASNVEIPVRSDVKVAEHIPTPPSWGVHIVKELPLDDVFQCLFKNDLFRLSWGAKSTHGEEWVKLQAEFEERLLAMHEEVKKDKWLRPQGVYGYFPAQSEGDELIVYDPETVNTNNPRELTRFSYPRQPDGDHLCLADYFAPVSSKIMDLVIFQVVTVGQDATIRFERLQDEGNYSESYFTHGLAVQMAEASAEYLHRHIRRELRMEPGQGKRYSWGFASIPNLADHIKVFQLLPAEKELGMKLTSAYQMVPEESTAAIIIHHPQAKYYNIGESRIEQLLKS
jgi:5-methyltetrahydrofolate--homocysteine methyltransferase